MYAPFLYAYPCYMVVLKSLRRGMGLRFSVRGFTPRTFCFTIELKGVSMEFWYVWVLPLIGGLILYAIISASVKAPGTALQVKFMTLGTLKGKTFNEIQNACGSPNSTSVGANGVKIYQWMATGYHIVLLFDENDICLGVSSETKV